MSFTTSRKSAPAARGLLKSPNLPGEHQRWLPCEKLSSFVEHFWFVGWDLRGQPEQTVSTLPHPSAHLVFEAGLTAEIVGVHTQRFVRRLSNQGNVFAVKFRPGGFYTFYKRNLILLRNQRVPIESVFGMGGATLGTLIENTKDNEQRMQLAEQFLMDHSPAADDSLALVTNIFALIRQDPSITSIDPICERFNISMRQLQRVFTRYVGVAPKWVLQRHRLHEILAYTHVREKPDWVQLAMQLGYNDQAHFIKDFKQSVGMTPEEYWKS